MPVMRFRVVCGRGDTIESFSPTRRFKSVDFPAFGRPMSDTKLFPGAVIQMIKVGENTGTLNEQLGVGSDYYGQELEYKIQRLTALFEPAVIIFMGVAVGFVAIALISAMYGIYKQVQV